MNIKVGKCYYLDGTYHEVLNVGGSFVHIKCLRADPNHQWIVGDEGKIQRESFERWYKPVKLEPGEIWRCKSNSTGTFYYKMTDYMDVDIVRYYSSGNNNLIPVKWNVQKYRINEFVKIHEYFGKVGKWCWMCGTACRRHEGVELAFDGLCWSCYEEA